MKTHEIWKLFLLFPLIVPVVACSADEDDDAAEETGDHESAGSPDDGDASRGSGGSGGGSGGGSAGSNGGDDDDHQDDEDDWDDDDDEVPDEPAGGDIGDQCTSNDDCATPICLFAGDADYGFCSVPCESWSDCPSFWDCVDVQNATLKYCAPD